MRGKMRAIYLTAICAISISGTAVASGAPPSQRDSAKPGGEIARPVPTRMLLRQTTLYVYSFLNMAENELTPVVIDKIHEHLRNALASKDITNKLWNFQPTSVVGTVSSAANYGSSFAPISISQTIRQNEAEEKKIGSKFRLVIVPNKFSVSLYSRYYDIDFLLINVDTDKIEWAYTYNGSHIVVFKESENSESRAGKIVSSVTDAMRNSGIID